VADLRKRFNGSDRAAVLLGPAAPQWCTMASLERLAAEGEPAQGIHTHLLESPAQRHYLDAWLGGSVVDWLDQLGFPAASFAHGVWLRRGEMELLAESLAGEEGPASVRLYRYLRDDVELVARSTNEKASKSYESSACWAGIGPAHAGSQGAARLAVPDPGADLTAFPAPDRRTGGSAGKGAAMTATVDEVSWKDQAGAGRRAGGGEENRRRALGTACVYLAGGPALSKATQLERHPSETLRLGRPAAADALWHRLSAGRRRVPLSASYGGEGGAHGVATALGEGRCRSPRRGRWGTAGAGLESDRRPGPGRLAARGRRRSTRSVACSWPTASVWRRHRDGHRIPAPCVRCSLACQAGGSCG
jgi:hypothetical protein